MFNNATSSKEFPPSHIHTLNVSTPKDTGKPVEIAKKNIPSIFGSTHNNQYFWNSLSNHSNLPFDDLRVCDRSDPSETCAVELI